MATALMKIKIREKITGLGSFIRRGNLSDDISQIQKIQGKFCFLL